MAGKFLIGAAVAFAMGAGAVAWAANSAVQSTDLAEGFGSVAACDHVPNWSYTFSKDGSGHVSDVHVTGIAPSCVGGSMRLTLTGPSYTAVANPVTITSCPTTCSVTVPFAAGPLPAQVTTANALIVGP